MRGSVARIALAVAVALAIAACAPKMIVMTPKGKVAYTANEIAKRVGQLQETVISAHNAGAIKDEVAIPIVVFTVTALKTLDATPEGWQAAVVKAWAQAKAIVPTPINPILAATWGAVDVILAAYGATPPPGPEPAPYVDPALIAAGERWLAQHGS